MATFTEISSPQNPRYKTWLKLLDSRGIKKNEQALVSGRSFIHEIVERYGDRIEAVIVRKKPDEPCGAALLDGLDVPQRCQIFALPGDMFAALDIYGIRGPILQISAPPPPAWNGELPLPGNDVDTASTAATPHCSMTVFVPFQNPINLGTTIRSAAAFDAGVVLLKEAATPYLPKSLRASGPGIFQVPLYSGPGLEELSQMDLPVFALSPRGRSIYDFDFAKACRLNAGHTGLGGAGIGLVAGLEGPGLDDYWPEDRRISIPMRPCVESLNASVSMSIAMAFFQAGLHRAGLNL